MAAWRISLGRVRELAKAQGITISQLARESGISRNTAKRWWRDDRSITSLDTDVLIGLCLTLDCTPGDLLQLEKDDD